MSNPDVCPHCFNVFTNEFKPKMLLCVKTASELLGQIPAYVVEDEFEAAWSALRVAEEEIKAARTKLCDVWDSIDSRGYASFCEEDEHG
jgi:hypothetical protein